MELAKLSRKGQVSIPKRLLKALGLEGEAYFLVELSPEGAIVLRPAGVYPVEIYSQARIREFLDQDQLTQEERERLAKALGERWCASFWMPMSSSPQPGRREEPEASSSWRKGQESTS